MFRTEDLDKEKFALEMQRTRDLTLMERLERKLVHARKSLEEKRRAMSSYESTFLVGGTVKQVEPAASREARTGSTAKHRLYAKPKARFGKHEAVTGTRKVIQRHLRQLSKLEAVMGKKLNTAQHRNTKMRESVNNLRREHLVYDRLFGKMQVEIAEVKANIARTKANIERRYKQRDAVRGKMKEAIEKLQEAQLVAKMEWQVLDKGLVDTSAQAQDSKDEGDVAGAGSLTQQQEEALKAQQQKSLWAIGKDRVLLDQLQARRDTFAAALDAVREQTGFSDLEELVGRMEEFEEQKFATVTAINKAMLEIEEREAAVQRMRKEFEEREAQNSGLTSSKHAALQAMQQERAATVKAVEKKEAEIKEVLRDLGAMLQPVQSLFAEVGAGSLLNSAATEMAQTAGAMPQEGPATAEPLSEATGLAEESKTDLASPGLGGSMRMYLASPSLQESMAEGVSVNSLAQFTAILEQSVAEVLQQYAVVLSQPQASSAGAAAVAALSSHGAAGAARTVKTGAPVPLGPTEGTNSSRTAITSSALLAALVEPEAMGASDDEEEQPLTPSQLRAQAAAKLQTQTFLAARKASQQAARYLSHTQERRKR